MITRIVLENFKQYRGKHTINFERGLNLIQGLNDSGKSSIFHALSFAFFNQTPTLGIHTTALITNGEQFTTVQVDFIDPKTGENFSIIRTKTKTKGEFELHKIGINGKEETTLSSRAGAREIDLQVKLSEHLDISKRLFFTVVYSEQKAFVNLARGGSDIKDDMDTLFGLKAAAVIRDGFRSVQRDLEKKLVGEEDVKRFLQSLKVDRERLKTRIQDSSNVIIKVRTQLSMLQEEISSINATKSAVSRLEAALLNADELTHQLKNKEDLVLERNLVINDILRKYDSSEPLRNQSLVVQQSLIEIEDKVKKLKERKMKLGENQKTLIQRHGYLINTLSERGSVEGLQVCPKCGQEVDKEHVHRELSKFKEELNGVEKILSEMSGETKALDLSYKYLEDERRIQERRRVTLDADIISLDEASRRVKLAEKEAEGLKMILDNAMQILSKEKTTLVNSLLPKFPEEAIMLRAAIVIEDLRTAFRNINSTVSSKASSVVTESGVLEKIVKDKTAEITNDTRVLTNKEEQIDEQETRLKRYEQIRLNIFTLNRLDKASQELSVKLRDSLFTSISSLTYFWYTQLTREKKYAMIGFDSDNYSLLAKPIGFDDLVSVKEYSGGGHETIFALALRLALSQTAGNRDFLLFDEPTDATDTQNRDQIIEALMNASQSFNQIILITHHGLGREYTVNTITTAYDPDDRSSRVLADN